MNVHLGHDKELPWVSERVDCGSATDTPTCSDSDGFVGETGFKLLGFRFEAAAMVAFKMMVSGGLIPHARQGGRGVEAVAVAGSKLEGTGLENEQMGQTHVAFRLWEVNGIDRVVGV